MYCPNLILTQSTYYLQCICECLPIVSIQEEYALGHCITCLSGPKQCMIPRLITIPRGRWNVNNIHYLSPCRALSFLFLCTLLFLGAICIVLTSSWRNRHIICNVFVNGCLLYLSKRNTILVIALHAQEVQHYVWSRVWLEYHLDGVMSITSSPRRAHFFSLCIYHIASPRG